MAKAGKISIGEIASRIALKEGKKVEVSHGNIREVLAIISDMVYADAQAFLSKNGKHEGFYAALKRNGERRAKAKKK